MTTCARQLLNDDTPPECWQYYLDELSRVMVVRSGLSCCQSKPPQINMMQHCCCNWRQLWKLLQSLLCTLLLLFFGLMFQVMLFSFQQVCQTECLIGHELL